MKSHIAIKAKGKEIVLPEDFSIDIDDQNPLFNETEMFSYPVPIPMEGNRFLVQNMDSPISDLRPVSLEHTPMQIIVDGLPFRSGGAKLAEDEELDGILSMNVDSATQSFTDLIGDLSCRDIPVKDKILIGEKIGNIKATCDYKFHATITYRKRKKSKRSLSSQKNDTASATFEPQALGFSYPGTCEVKAGSTIQEAVVKMTHDYPDDKRVNIPKVTKSFINVSEPYPNKPYCNARVCYKHLGLEDGKTSSDTINPKDATNTYEDFYPYWVLDADRPQSGVCFYVLYFLDCLFAHLGVEFDNSALREIGDLNRLCFFTTHCKYDTAPIHGVGDKQYIWKYSILKDKKGNTLETTQKVCLGAYLSKQLEVTGITEYYLFSNSQSEMPLAPVSGTELRGWTSSLQVASVENRYLWSVQLISFSDGTSAVTIPYWLGIEKDTPITSVDHYYVASDNTTLAPTQGWSTSVPTFETAKPFFQNMDDMNKWLESRGCGGKFTFEEESTKEVQSFDYQEKFLGGLTIAKTVVVGQDNIESVKISAKVSSKTITGNVLGMYANSQNFPDESVSTIIKSLENSFGIKFYYDYERKKVTAYMLRKIFRSQQAPIDFAGKVYKMHKVNEKITGFRMCYSKESDTKEQRQNIAKGKKDYNTDYDYIEYPRQRTITDKVYKQIYKNLSSADLNVYVDKTTGNAFRVKVDSEASDANSLRPVLFEVGTYKGVSLGDCSKQNEDYVKEFASNFEPMVFNDVNYRNELALAGGLSITGTDSETGKTYSVTNVNKNRVSPILAAFINEDMEHEFVLQKIRNLLGSSWADFYLTEELRLRESYDPSKTEDGNSPLQSKDWGLAIAIMRGGGVNADVQRYDYDFDGFGNSKWRMVAGEYALTSDSIDMMGNEYDYNGTQEGVGNEERFSLKICAYKQPEWAPAPLCDPDVRNKAGKVEKKILTRGLYDTFMSEYAHFLLHRKKYIIHCTATAAQIADIPNHWRERYRINGVVGYINKVSYNISVKEGIKDIEIEFYAL